MTTNPRDSSEFEKSLNPIYTIRPHVGPGGGWDWFAAARRGWARDWIAARTEAWTALEAAAGQELLPTEPEDE